MSSTSFKTCNNHLRELTIKKVDASQNNTHSAFLVTEWNHNERHLYFYDVPFLEGLRGRIMESTLISVYYQRAFLIIRLLTMSLPLYLLLSDSNIPCCLRCGHKNCLPPLEESPTGRHRCQVEHSRYLPCRPSE